MSGRVRHVLVRLVAITAATSVSLGMFAMASPKAAAEEPVDVTQASQLLEHDSSKVVTSDELPTVQLDGSTSVVWAQDIVGNTVYAGGSFSNVHPANTTDGTNLTPRSNLLAYNITNGNLVTAWAPSVNGTVMAVKASPDGSRVYVGGSFTVANGATRYNLAAFDAQTGALVSSFNAAVGGTSVYAIAVTDSAVYVGGLLQGGNGVARQNLMAFSTSNGALLDWAPTTDLQVDAMVLDPAGQNLIIGGRFGRVNGVGQRGLAALDLTSGALVPYAAANTVKNGVAAGTSNAGKAGIFALTADAGAVYGTGWVFADVATGNLEGLFAADAGTGNIRWVADAHGDHYGVWSDGNVVYSTSHEHAGDSFGATRNGTSNQENTRNSTALTAQRMGTLSRTETVSSIYQDWSGTPSPAEYNWYPEWIIGNATSAQQAGWTVTGNSNYIAVGGEFVGVNNRAQRGLVRFAKNPPGGDADRPRLTGTDWAPTGRAPYPGVAEITIPLNYDRDDLNLTYELRRDGKTVARAVRPSAFWQRLAIVRLSESNLDPGTYAYTVRAVDQNGNIATSSSVNVAVSSGVALSSYAKAVTEDGPDFYWRLGSGTSVSDTAGNLNGVASSGVTNTPGALVGDTNQGSNLSGSSRRIASASAKVVPTELSEELWFKTTTNQGGLLMSYGNQQTNNSTTYDRALYMSNDGKINFASYFGVWRSLQTPSSYNDGQWHHVVVTQSMRGATIYVDGAPEVANNDVRYGRRGFNAYVRVGGDQRNGLPNLPTSQWFAGAVDEVAAYPYALSADRVIAHRDAGQGATPPVAAFTSASTDLAATFDASGSQASTGRTIASYSWDFGDDTTGTGAQANHLYVDPGTYTVTLTVTDSAGSSGSVSKSVVVTPPHVAPVASIDYSAADLMVSFDGSGSSASGGATVDSYEWDFGDNESATSQKPVHEYAAPGTYDVRLRVTDSKGATSAWATTSVTVKYADPVASFTTSVDGLKVSADASASSGPDGATLSYSWKWGDSSSDGSGKTATHTYASAGTYTVTLTVTSSLGGSSTTTKSVTIVGPVTVVAADAFERTVGTGWGNADTGGAWTTPSWSGANGVSVSGGKGSLSLASGQTRGVELAAQAGDSTSQFTVSLDKLPVGTTPQFNYVVHQTSAGEYRVKLRYLESGQVRVWITRQVGSTETLISSDVLVPGYTQTAGGTAQVKLETAASGASTTLRAKVWAAGGSEPTSWTVSATDGTTSLQGPGGIGFRAYAPAALTNGPITFKVDDLSVTTQNAVPHVAPVASIDYSAADLMVSFDGSGSSASGGATVDSYEWDFGDNESATSQKPVHEYAAPGTYDVRLRVTDSKGATSAWATTSVTVKYADPVASFTTSVDGLKVSADASASSGPDGATLSYSWKWGDSSSDGSGKTATHTYASAGTYTVTLTVTSSLGGSSTTTKSVTVATMNVVASDAFDRTVASGWGAADTGGNWSGTTGLSVSDGAGRISLTPSATRTTSLPVSVGDSVSQFTASLNKVPAGTTPQFNYQVHQTSTGDDYRLKLRYLESGQVRVWITRQVGSTETLISGDVLVPTYTHTAGGTVRVKLQTATAGASTTLQAKVWADGGTEPTSWTVSASDATVGLQAPGAIGFRAYAPAALTNGPIVFSVDNLTVS